MIDERAKKIIRKRREVECFAICDRAAWFYDLPKERKNEVRAWRNAWLVATETGIIPKRPSWIK